MSITVLLIVLLLLALIGGIVPWMGNTYSVPPQVPPGQPVPPVQPAYLHGYGYGPFVPGAIGLILLVLIVLVVAGRL